MTSSSSSSSPETRPSLLIRLRDVGDNEAWSEFVDVYSPLVYGFLRRRGLQGFDAADVTQEVFSRISRSMPGFIYNREQGRFRDWLWTVTRNEIHRFRDRRRSRATGDISSVDEALSGLVTRGDSAEWNDEFHRHILATAMQRIESSFEPATWRAFQLVWVENLPALDAASLLQQPVDFVYVAKSRVLKRLREEVLVLADDLALAAW